MALKLGNLGYHDTSRGYNSTYTWYGSIENKPSHKESSINVPVLLLLVSGRVFSRMEFFHPGKLTLWHGNGKPTIWNIRRWMHLPEKHGWSSIVMLVFGGGGLAVTEFLSTQLSSGKVSKSPTISFLIPRSQKKRIHHSMDESGSGDR